MKNIKKLLFSEGRLLFKLQGTPAGDPAKPDKMTKLKDFVEGKEEKPTLAKVGENLKLVTDHVKERKKALKAKPSPALVAVLERFVAVTKKIQTLLKKSSADKSKTSVDTLAAINVELRDIVTTVDPNLVPEDPFREMIPGHENWRKPKKPAKKKGPKPPRPAPAVAASRARPAAPIAKPAVPAAKLGKASSGVKKGPRLTKTVEANELSLDVKHKIDHLDKNYDEIALKLGKAKYKGTWKYKYVTMSRVKASKEYKAGRKKLNGIKKEYEAADKIKEPAKKIAAMKKINTRIDKVAEEYKITISQRPGKRSAGPATTPGRPAAEPAAGPKKAAGLKTKSKETFAKTPEGNVSKLLSKIFPGSIKYKEIKALKVLVGKLNLSKPTQKGVDTTTLLPGGYSITMANWGSDNKPSMVISKGEHVMLAEVGGQWLPPNLIGDNVMPLVNIMRADAELKGVLKDFDQENNRFANPNSIKIFKRTLLELGKITGKAPWSTVYADIGAKIYCKSKDPSGTKAMFTIQVGNKRFFYDTGKPDSFITGKRDKQGKPKYKKGNNLNNFHSNIPDSTLRAREAKGQQDKVAKREEAKTLRREKAGKATTVLAERKEGKEKQRGGNMVKMLEKGAANREDIQYLGRHSFKVKNKTGRAYKRKIDRIKIHDLLDFSQVGDKVVIVKVGAQRGMYYPGQGTCFKIDAKGKQTGSHSRKNRLKFNPGQKITVEAVRTPTADDFSNLHSKWQRKLSKDKPKHQAQLAEDIKKDVKSATEDYCKAKVDFKFLATAGKGPLKKIFDKLVKTDKLTEESSMDKGKWAAYLKHPNVIKDSEYQKGLTKLLNKAIQLQSSDVPQGEQPVAKGKEGKGTKKRTVKFG